MPDKSNHGIAMRISLSLQSQKPSAHTGSDLKCCRLHHRREHAWNCWFYEETFLADTTRNGGRLLSCNKSGLCLTCSAPGAGSIRHVNTKPDFIRVFT